MPYGWEAPTPEFHRFAATTVDEARAMYAEYGQKVTVEDARIPEPFACAIWVVQIGPLQVSRHALAAGLVVRIERDDLYGVGVSPLGHMTVDQRAGRVTTSRALAVTTDPAAGPLTVHAHPASRLDCLVVDRETVAEHLTDHLGYRVRPGFRFPGAADLTDGTGRALRGLIELMLDSADDPASILRRPVVTEPLRHAVLDALLLAVEHPYRAELRRPVGGRIGHRPVRAAVEAVHEHPELPHTPASLARLTGVSVRTLQDAFRRQLDSTPMAYLREVRLARVHDDLMAGRFATVAEVAYRWGFTHLGRFAAAYRARYGLAPSQTPRTDRPRRAPGPGR